MAKAKGLERNLKYSKQKPGEAIEIIDWESEVKILMINSLDKTTCDIFIVAESTKHDSSTIKQFIKSSEENTENAVKCLKFDDITQNIWHFSENPIESTKQVHVLYKEAANVCKQYLISNKTIPCNLMVLLIKLQIAFIIENDEDTRRKRLFVDLELERLRAALIEGDQKKVAKPAKDTKTKVTGKNTQDGCTSTATTKVTTRIKQEDIFSGKDISRVDIQNRHLYIMLVGFHDFDLIKNLMTTNTKISAVFELISNNKKQSYKDSEKLKALNLFWYRVHENFEGENCPVMFNNTFYKKILIDGDAFDILGDWGTRTNSFKRQHANYLRNLKLIKLKPEPQLMHVSQLTTYCSIMDLIPPDCVNIEILLYALVQQVCGKREQIDKVNIAGRVETHRGFKSQISNVLKCSIQSPLKEAVKVVGAYPQPTSTKMTFDLNYKPFLIENGNELEIKLRAYKKLSSILLSKNYEILKLIYPALFWKGYPIPTLNDNDFKLYALAKQIKVLENELHYFMHSIIFTRIKGCIKPQNWITGVESLAVILMLQELQKAEYKFLHCDHTYCEFDDSILLRYYNNIDHSGLNTVSWNESLRTVLHLREFCQFILEEDSSWIEKQEKIFQEKCNKEFVKACKADNELKRTIYPELVFYDYHFIQPNSIKAKALLEVENEGSKKKDKGGKTNGKAKKGKTANETIAFLEKLSKPTAFPEIPDLTPRLAVENEPYSFYAYDLDEQRLQLTGSTTIFLYGDLKITSDSVRFFGSAKNFSLNIELDGNNLIVYPKAQRTNFHFTLNDQTILVFTKPYKPDAPEVKLAKRICEAVKQKEEKRQNIYFLSQQQNCVVKCFNVPFLTKRSVILSEQMLRPFLEQMGKRGLIAKVNESSTSVRNILEEISEGKKHDFSVISKTVSNISVKQKENVQSNTEIKAKISSKSLNKIKSLNKPFPKDIANKIKETINAHLPLFNICSSKLHRYRYVRRIKSHIGIEIGGNLKRIICKPPIIGKTTFKICKLLPVNTCELNYEYTYDIHIALPSGLTLSTIAGFDNNPVYIRQLYIDKGPQCLTISDEYSRTFMRDGNILIKKNNGDVTILGSNGQIVYCEVPYVRVKRGNLPRKTDISNLTSLHINSTDLNKFQKNLYRIINRLYKNTLHSHRASHRQCQKRRKLRVKDPNQVYILRKSTENWNKFCLVTTNGKKLKVTKNKITEEKKYNVLQEMDHRYHETYTIRDDGTQSIINEDSCLVTQFPDGTRITTWPEVEQNLLFLTEMKIIPPSDFIDAEQQVSLKDFEEEEAEEVGLEGEFLPEGSEEILKHVDLNEEEISTSISSSTESSIKHVSRQSSSEFVEIGWVSIQMNTKYEHPNYSTVIYYGRTNMYEILLPNNIRIEAQNNGNCKISVNEIMATVTSHTVNLEKNGLKTTVSLNYKHELLEVTDVNMNASVFTINNNGLCHSNVTKLSPIQDEQALFLLKRNLKGCRFWTSKALQEYKSSKPNIAFFNNCLENKIHITQFWHQKYVIPYSEPLSLTKYKQQKSSLTPQTAYTSVQTLEYLPDISQFDEVIELLASLLFGKQDDFIQLLYDISNEEYKKNLEELKMASIVLETKEKTNVHKVFEERTAKWRNECEQFKQKIREKQVQCYFDFQEDRERRRTEKEKARIAMKKCRCPHSVPSTIDTLGQFIGIKTDFGYDIRSNISESTSYSLSLASENLEKPDLGLLSGATKFSKATIKEQEITKEPIKEEDDVLIQKIDADNKPQQLELEWPNNALSDLLLHEIKTTIGDYIFVKDMTFSEKKVAYLTQNLLCNIRQAVAEYDSDCPLKEFVTKSVNALIESLRKTEPTLNEITQVVKNIYNLALQSAVVEDETVDTTFDKSSLYNIYKHYSTNMLKPVYKCSPHSSAIRVVFKNQLFGKAVAANISYKPMNQITSTVTEKRSSAKSSSVVSFGSLNESVYSDKLEWYSDEAVAIPRNDMGASLTVLLDSSLINARSPTSTMSVEQPAFTNIDPAENVPVPRTMQTKFQRCSQCEILSKQHARRSTEFVEKKSESGIIHKCLNRATAQVTDQDDVTARYTYPAFFHPDFPDSKLISPHIEKSTIWRSAGTQTQLKSTYDIENSTN